MTIPSILIADLPDAGTEQPRDRYALQRDVLGTWTDFFTEARTISGPVQLFVFDWDMSASLYEEITAATPGNYLILLNAFATFTPGTNTPGTGATIKIFNSGNPTSSYAIDIVIGAEKYGVIAYPYDDPASNIYDSLDTPIALDLVVAPATFDSTMRIYVQYVEVEPI